MSEIRLYKAIAFGYKITEIVATRITDSGYYYVDSQGKETWSDRDNGHSAVFETRDEAIEWMLRHLLAKHTEVQSALIRASEAIKAFNEKYPQS